MHGAGEGHKRPVVRCGKHAVVHGAEPFAADPDEVKTLHGLDRLRRERREDAQLIENPLAVRLDCFASKSSRRTRLPFQYQHGNAPLSQSHAKDRTASPRPDHNNFNFHRQSS